MNINPCLSANISSLQHTMAKHPSAASIYLHINLSLMCNFRVQFVGVIAIFAADIVCVSIWRKL